MSGIPNVEVPHYWRAGVSLWAAVLVLAVVAGAVFFDGVHTMVRWWSNRDEYSHGFLIPPLVAYLVWQRGDRLREIPFTGSWLGVACALMGLACYVLGELATVYTVVQYGFVLFVIGSCWAITGWRAFRLLAIPMLLLFFMVPFPNFIYNTLSAKLQLVSSSLGVSVIRAFDISVYLEGNVIDLGAYKLQVVEACNGLRYLFPLVTLGVIVAYFFHAPLWQRLVVVVSTVPITVLMNSFRIGVIGIMVEYWGQSMAEGFLHQFEGWVIFMACFGILFVEMWLLMRMTGDRRPLGQAFGIDPPASPDPAIAWRSRRLPLAAVLLLVCSAAAAVPLLGLPERAEAIPTRESFVTLPLEMDGWTGRRGRLEQVYLDGLKLDDYVVAEYRHADGATVNLYSAWYDSQQKGRSVHSPKSCLPGGGWAIESLSAIPVSKVSIEGVPLRVNRAEIALGEARQLVYYWFQQRGRVLTNEYLVKWFVFWDSLTRRRSDGALVRLITTVAAGEDVAVADARLTAFASSLAPSLPERIPK